MIVNKFYGYDKKIFVYINLFQIVLNFIMTPIIDIQSIITSFLNLYQLFFVSLFPITSWLCLIHSTPPSSHLISVNLIRFFTWFCRILSNRVLWFYFPTTLPYLWLSQVFLLGSYQLKGCPILLSADLLRHLVALPQLFHLTSPDSKQ